MNRKYYLVLILVLSVSVLLLGLSYSKDSSNNIYTSEFESYDHSLKISTSDNIKEVKVEDFISRDIGVINNGVVKATFVVEVLTNSLDGLTYSINNGEVQKLDDNIIYTQELDALGADNDNDFTSFNIKIYNNTSEAKVVTLKIYQQANLLKDKIVISPNVYKDELDNYHYYGDEVNNYVKYNNILYRIVGLMNNRIVLVEDEIKNSTYNPLEDDYLSIDDYLASFNDNNVNLNNVRNYHSWLTDSYWLLNTYGDNEAYYLDNGLIVRKNKNNNLGARKIIKLYIDAEIILGDGSKNNPYEVVYGS